MIKKTSKNPHKKLSQLNPIGKRPEVSRLDYIERKERHQPFLMFVHVGERILRVRRTKRQRLSRTSPDVVEK